MAILARTNLLPMTVVDVLLAQEIPMVLKDGTECLVNLQPEI